LNEPNEVQKFADYEIYKKPVNEKLINSHFITDSIKALCPYCLVNRTITTNGKCRVCGAMLAFQKHWKPTINKLRLISQHGKNKFPLEINHFMYFVPFEYLAQFENIEHHGFKSHVELIELIKKNCQHYKIRRA